MATQGYRESALRAHQALVEHQVKQGQPEALEHPGPAVFQGQLERLVHQGRPGRVVQVDSPASPAFPVKQVQRVIVVLLESPEKVVFLAQRERAAHREYLGRLARQVHLALQEHQERAAQQGPRARVERPGFLVSADSLVLAGRLGQLERQGQAELQAQQVRREHRALPGRVARQVLAGFLVLVAYRDSAG